MELNTIMQALVKDMAVLLRPVVEDMVREALADVPRPLTGGQLEVMARHLNLEELATQLASDQLALIAGHLNMADLAGELSDGQLNNIAGDIDLSDLADEIDVDKIAAKVDIDESIREFFSNNTFSLSP